MSASWRKPASLRAKKRTATNRYTRTSCSCRRKKSASMAIHTSSFSPRKRTRISRCRLSGTRQSGVAVNNGRLRNPPVEQPRKRTSTKTCHSNHAHHPHYIPDGHLLRTVLAVPVGGAEVEEVVS